MDIWNYWHFALAGTLVYYATDNFFLGLLAAGIAAVVVLKIADWSAPMVERTFELEGVSMPTLSAMVFFPIGILFNWIIDRIPGIRNINIRPDAIQRRLGVFGEPMMIGTILGLLLGVAAGYGVQETLTLGINLGAVMFILPKMVAILMEGLLPLSNSIKKWLTKRYPDRADLYIGLDIAVAIGEPAVIATGLLLVPISLVMAFLVPGNNVLPLGDLANLAVFASMIVLACRANIFRALLISIPILVGNLLIATAIAPVITNMAKGVQFDLGGASQVVRVPRWRQRSVPLLAGRDLSVDSGSPSGSSPSWDCSYGSPTRRPRLRYTESKMKPSLTVDIGTTSVKLGLFDEVGGLVHAVKLTCQLPTQPDSIRQRGRPLMVVRHAGSPGGSGILPCLLKAQAPRFSGTYRLLRGWRIWSVGGRGVQSAVTNDPLA